MMVGSLLVPGRGNTMNRIAAVVAGLSLAFVGTSATIADTINVPADQPTIAAAIAASSDGYVIKIAPGIYNEHSLNPGGKAITIQGELDTMGLWLVSIDAQQAGSVFIFNSGEGYGTVIKDLNIIGGFAPGGGGIYCSGSSSPNITGCSINSNTAGGDGGGGIYCDNNSNPLIVECIMFNNNTTYAGGGIYCRSSSPSIISSDIFQNSAFIGGGMYCRQGSDPRIESCEIWNNTAESGGGLYCDTSSVNIYSSVIRNNTASDGAGSGGGIFTNLGEVVLWSSTVCGNVPNPIIGTLLALGTDIFIDPICSGVCCYDPSVAPCITRAQGATRGECLSYFGKWIDAGTNCNDCPPPCLGDTDNNGEVDVNDVLLVIAEFGVTCP